VAFDHNWWSPLDRYRDAPTALGPHGTHVAGTAVGGAGIPGGAPVGVAPGAKFISALACTATGCPLAGVLSGLQFMLAPTDRDGNAPDPSLRPEIVSNSWQRADEEAPLERAVTALEAAGVLPVFAVGNGGPACATARTPGARDDLLLGVGATDRLGLVAGFSGRGPSTGGGADPDVVAPGVGVVSSVPGGDYAISSGTSMAVPAVAGIAALVIQANPALRGDLVGVVATIRRSSRPVGGPECGRSAGGRRNNVGGYGLVDAPAAVRIARGPSGSRGRRT
jgi:subtilisin family serine protease